MIPDFNNDFFLFLNIILPIQTPLVCPFAFLKIHFHLMLIISFIIITYTSTTCLSVCLIPFDQTAGLAVVRNAREIIGPKMHISCMYVCVYEFCNDR